MKKLSQKQSLLNDILTRCDRILLFLTLEKYYYDSGRVPVNIKELKQLKRAIDKYKYYVFEKAVMKTIDMV